MKQNIAFNVTIKEDNARGKRRENQEVAAHQSAIVALRLYSLHIINH